MGFGQNRFQQYDGPTQKSHHMHHIQFQTNFPNAQFTDISTLDILQRLPLLLHKLDIIYKKNSIRDRRLLTSELQNFHFLDPRGPLVEPSMSRPVPSTRPVPRQFFLSS